MFEIYEFGIVSYLYTCHFQEFLYTTSYIQVDIGIIQIDTWMYSEFGEGATRVRYGRNTAHNIIICIIVMKQWQCSPYYSITLTSTLCNVHTTLHTCC